MQRMQFLFCLAAPDPDLILRQCAQSQIWLRIYPLPALEVSSIPKSDGVCLAPRPHLSTLSRENQIVVWRRLSETGWGPGLRRPPQTVLVAMPWRFCVDSGLVVYDYQIPDM